MYIHMSVYGRFEKQVVVILKSLIEDGQLALPDGRRPRRSASRDLTRGVPAEDVGVHIYIHV